MVNYGVSPPSPNIFFYPLPSRILKLQVIKSHRFWRIRTKTDDLRARLSASEYIKSPSNWYIQKIREESKKQTDFVLCLPSSQVRILRRLTEILNSFLTFENRGNLNPHYWVKAKDGSKTTEFLTSRKAEENSQNGIVSDALNVHIFSKNSSHKNIFFFKLKNVSGFSHKRIISGYPKWKSSTTSLVNLELWPWWFSRSGSK